MSSKYSSLPDIASTSFDTAPDVYETADVPLEATHALDSDSDSDLLPPRAGSPASTRRGALNPAHASAGPSSSNSRTHSPDDENLVGKRLDAREARRRFQGARFERGQSRRSIRKRTEKRGRGGPCTFHASSQKKSSSSSSSRRLPTTSTYALGASPSLKEGNHEPETTLERLRRLRFEITELEEDVRKEQAAQDEQKPPFEATGDQGQEPGESPPTDLKGKRKKVQREVSPAVLLQQLQMLRGDLGALQVNEEEIGTNVLHGEGQKVEPGSALSEKVQTSSSLLAKLGAATNGKPPLASTSQSGLTTVGRVDDQGSTNRGDLERRVAEIEKLVGASEADVDEAHPIPPPLLTTVGRLDHLLTLLTQPRHLDSISRRVKVLVSELERLHESRRKLGDTRPLNIALSGGMTVSNGPASSADKGPTTMNTASVLGGSVSHPPQATTSSTQLPPDALQKIDALFALLPRLDPLLPLAPRVLNRLRSLSTLHTSAHEFGSTLAQLREEVGRLTEAEKGLQEVVEGFGTSLEENEGRMKGNLEGLEKRVKEVVQRLEALGSEEDEEDE
ncbi:BZ3500_MvSof-1268-A1-R1_Chr2-1g04382 [Microbotryum saponariae]|uniref:BZ3500_MvSof-1268-A1-R1_Chr2-1g04382 protein n=1 Tax=Microbotryum saponariae TaxID=289078 RepID=A0A2X0KKJ2_9BASI|nr:BZ3500_MvSof-1268-A1-R1_Chr2-1g04382 [Microbotryum saponariae]SCZ91596.1 BZ3501_MvSof-1269-A2-R1_Chr2-1g04038 [Microbotryum saponariae]